MNLLCTIHSKLSVKCHMDSWVHFHCNHPNSDLKPFIFFLNEVHDSRSHNELLLTVLTSVLIFINNTWIIYHLLIFTP